MVSYHCRTSLISVMSPPLELDDRALAWPTAFSRRVVHADFEKTFFRALADAAPDLLLLDLVEERHELLRCGDSYAAHSRDLIDAGFQPQGFEVLGRFAPEVEALWYPAATRFARMTADLFPELPVVLHRAFGLMRFRDGRGVHAFPEARIRIVTRTNEMLERFYAHLGAELPRSRVLELPRTFVADAAHLWGLAPYHYEDAYYTAAAARLSAIMSS